MIDWIDEKLRAWGRAKHRLIADKEPYPPSILGKIKDYGMAVQDGSCFQHFREGMTGDALDASLALFRAMHARKMTDRQYEVVFVHYACRGHSVMEKLRALGYERRASYYECLDRAQTTLCEHFQ